MYRTTNDSGIDPHTTVLDDVTNGVADLGMCHLWMHYNHYLEHDLSMFMDRQCVTFLVPINELVSEGSTIYLALSATVWALFIGTMVIVGIVYIRLIRFYHLNMMLHKSFNTFDYLTKCYTDLIHIASSHGIQRFPKSLALKIIVIRLELYS